MNTKQIARTLAILAILSVNIGCDQISKSIVRKKIDYNDQISLLSNYLTLTKIENTGAFLSVGDSLPQPIKTLLLTFLPVLVLSISLIFVITKQGLPRMTIFGICFVIGGGIGNVYDRVVYGSVTDFLHIDFIIFSTGIFNLADVSIMTGIFVILVDTYFRHDKLNYKSSVD